MEKLAGEVAREMKAAQAMREGQKKEAALKAVAKKEAKVKAMAEMARGKRRKGQTHKEINGIGSERVCGTTQVGKILCCVGRHCDRRHHWRSLPGNLDSVAVSDRHMWGVNSHGRIYFSSGTGREREDERHGVWHYIAGHLKQIAVSGSAVWGVTRNDRIFYRNGHGGKWQQIRGRLKQIAVSGEQVWGVTSSGNIYHRKGRAGRWQLIPGHLNQIAVSMANVWGVTRQGHVFYRHGKRGTWQSVNGRFKQVAVSGEHVWGLTHSDAIYSRHGTGGAWVRTSGVRLNQISVSAGASEPSKPGCWYLQQQGCPKHPGMTGARGLWHLDHHQWARQSHHACRVVRKKQIEQWCKSSSTMHFVPAQPEVSHEETAVKEKQTKVAQLEAQNRAEKGDLERASKAKSQTTKKSPPARPCPQRVPRWQRQAKRNSALTKEVTGIVHEVIEKQN